jgi:hypothetical protein
VLGWGLAEVANFEPAKVAAQAIKRRAASARIKSCGVLVVVLRITCFSEFMLLSCSREGSSVTAPLDLRLHECHYFGVFAL